MDNLRIQYQQTDWERPLDWDDGPQSLSSRAIERKERIELGLIGVAILVVLALGIWLSSAGNIEIDELPARVQHALYERTLATLGDFCDPKKALRGIDAYCQEQANFIVKFRECDDVCRARSAQHQPRPTR
jgi:hypothetical protein